MKVPSCFIFKRADMESSKVYVDVTAEFSKEGALLPKSFRWEDGQIYEIEQVKGVRRRNIMKKSWKKCASAYR
jgi:hypothetical protein